MTHFSHDPDWQAGIEALAAFFGYQPGPFLGAAVAVVLREFPRTGEEDAREAFTTFLVETLMYRSLASDPDRLLWKELFLSHRAHVDRVRDEGRPFSGVIEDIAAANEVAAAEQRRIAAVFGRPPDRCAGACGTATSDLRPIGEGGAWVCMPCVVQTFGLEEAYQRSERLLDGLP